MTRHSPSRHVSRRAALQVLYAADLAANARDGEESAIADVFERVSSNFDLHAGAREFAWDLVTGVSTRQADLDGCIAQHARNWRVERMAAVDRNVLRLAAFELLHTETPSSVVLDEAVELARDFGGERSPSFVNGVLDAIAEDRRMAEFAAGDATERVASSAEPGADDVSSAETVIPDSKR